jgi:hypothetical protein
LEEGAGVIASNREQSWSNSCESAEEKKLVILDERLAGDGGVLFLDAMEILLIW